MMLMGSSMGIYKFHRKVATTDDSEATLVSYSSPLGSNSNQLCESLPTQAVPTQLPLEELRRPTEFLNTQSTETGLVNANMEEQGHTRALTKEMGEAILRELLNELLEKFQSQVGPERANALYKAHVCRRHFLLVHGVGEREKTLAKEMQERLKEEGRAVKGPWSIIYGENVLDAWQRLSSTAMAVVVLLSPSLFQDTGLCRLLSEMKHSHPDTIVPLMLEPLSPQGLPPNLAFLTHINGSVVPESHWDPRSFIRSLLEKFKRFKYLCQEIQDLNILMGKVNTNYVCPCGRC